MNGIREGTYVVEFVSHLGDFIVREELKELQDLSYGEHEGRKDSVLLEYGGLYMILLQSSA